MRTWFSLTGETPGPFPDEWSQMEIKRRKSACPVALTVCALLKWKHDRTRTKLISVSFPLHQKKCLLDLTTVLLYHFFYLRADIWCSWWMMSLLVNCPEKMNVFALRKSCSITQSPVTFLPLCFTTCKSCLYR